MNLNIDNSPNLNLNSPFAIINSDRSMTKEPKNFLKKVPKEHLISFFFNKDETKEATFEDGRVTKFLFNKLMYVDVASLIMSSLGLIISVMQYDLEYLEPSGFINGYLSWIIFISTIILLFFTTARYYMQLDLMKNQKLVSKDKSFRKSPLFIPYVLEMLVLAPCPLPFTIDMGFEVKNYKGEMNLTWNVNYVLSLYILLRSLVISRVFLNLTSYCNYRASRIGRMYGINANYFYSIRCMMKNCPGKFLVIVFVAIIILFGHAIRISERFSFNSADPMKFGYYYNSFWAVIVTMTTVGYGDYYPKTIPGRFIIFLVCIIGIFVVSSIVVTLTDYLKLSSEESKVLNIIMRLQKRLEVKKNAAFVLTIMGKIHFIQKNQLLSEQQKENQTEIMQEKLKDHIKAFKTNKRELRDMFEGFSDSENMKNNFEFVRMKFYDLLDKQKKVNELNDRIALALGLNLDRT